MAVVGGRLANELVDVTTDLAALESSGFWAVVITFEGAPVCGRFACVRPAPAGRDGTGWEGPCPAAWRTSIDATRFATSVDAIRAAIADGDVYQVNLTRRLSAPVDGDADVAALGAHLAATHPAPHAAVVRLPGTAVASASPERFLRRDGALVESRPIKGTAADARRFLAKDRAENVMIVDLVRNDLGRVCDYASVEVPALCRPEEHPGLVHLVSTVRGRLRRGVGWPELIDATFPLNAHGLTVGDGVFETLDTVDGKPFAVRRHLERLSRSAAGLGLRAPPPDVLRSAIDEVCGRCPLERYAVRVTVTGGPGPLGSMRGEAGPTVVVATMPARGWPPVGDVVVVPWPRNERGALTGLKTTSYG